MAGNILAMYRWKRWCSSDRRAPARLKGARSHEASGRNGEWAHRRGAFPRGRLEEFKAFPASRRTIGLTGCRRLAHSPFRALASWLLAPLDKQALAMRYGPEFRNTSARSPEISTRNPRNRSRRVAGPRQ